MISTVIFHETAELELIEAAEYYESIRKGLGMAFISEIERAIKQIRQHPDFAPVISKKIRRIVLPRFPYNILFSIKENSIQILAIAHQKRRPFYWHGRR